MGWVNPKTNEIIAQLKGVRPVLREHRDRGMAAAKTLLAPHDQAGGSRIGKSSGRIDQYYYLEDADTGSGEPAALAIEYGWTAADGTPVEGLHVLRRSINAM